MVEGSGTSRGRRFVIALGETLDESLIGGKGASLSRMARAGFPVPPGFSVTTEAYRRFLQENGLVEMIAGLLHRADSATLEESERLAQEMERAFLAVRMPADLREEVLAEYERLAGRPGPVHPRPVSVRSSATSEDLAEASFAGQHSTFINVLSGDAVLESVVRCWASLWSPQALRYRANQGFDHTAASMSVVVQQMVPATCSGVMFTANPVTGDLSEIVINASWGLGEAIVSGLVTPDSIVVSKGSLEVMALDVASKETMAVMVSGGAGTAIVPVPLDRVYAPSLTDEQVVQLARTGLALEEHYGIPVDVEWCFEGDRLSLLQSRPITTL